MARKLAATLLAILLGLTALLGSFANAQDDAADEKAGVIEVETADDNGEEEDDIIEMLEVEEEEEEEPLVPHPDVKTSTVFVRPSTSGVLIGEEGIILVGFKNAADVEFNITSVTAAIVLPQDFSYYVQNFTIKAIDTVIKPGQQAAFEYSFTPDARFEPRNLGFLAEIRYNSGGQNYSSAFFNGTIDLVEGGEPFDMQSFFMYLSAVAAAGFVVVLVQRNVKSSGSKPSAPIELGTKKSQNIDSSWLEGTSADPRLRGSSSPRRRKA